MDWLSSVFWALNGSWAYNLGAVTLIVTDRPIVAAQWVWLSAALRTLLLVVAIWRVSYMLVMEDGPWGLVARLRSLRGTELSPNHELISTRVGTAWACTNCMSVWVAAWMPFLPSWLIYVAAFSGATIWLRRHIV